MLLPMVLTNTDALKIGQLSEEDLRRFAQQLLSENAVLQAVNIDLMARVAWLQRIAFGKKSERSSKNNAAAKAAEQAAKESSGGDAPITGTLLSTPVQNDLTDDEADAPLTDAAETPSPTNEAPPAKPDAPADAPAKNSTHTGRRKIPKHLRVIEDIIAVPESDRRLSDGTPMVFLGYEEHSRMHHISELVQLIIRRERWGVRTNGEPCTLITAAMPPALSVKGKFTDAFILKLMLDKFSLGVPFNRQCRELNAQGAALNRSTMCDQLEIAVTPLAPIAAAVRDQILAEPFIHADETPHKFQLRNEKGRCTGTKTGYYLALLAGQQAYFEFAVSRAQCHILKLLGFDPDALTDPTDDGLPDANGKETKPTIGFLMADAYAGYNRACGPGRYDRLACLAHGRRKFEIYEQLDPNAADIMTMINGLYRIERDAKRESARLKLNHNDTAALYFTARQTHSVPLLAKLKLRLSALVDVYAPSEGLSKAVAYFLKRWDDFTRYTSSGFLPIDNNAAERSIRGIVIGRKNWYFAGSEDAAGWAAIMHTLIESCRLQGIDPRAYLHHVIALLHREPATDPATLTPRALAPQLKIP
jgi:transposase